jgi:hypothetical protein
VNPQANRELVTRANFGPRHMASRLARWGHSQRPQVRVLFVARRMFTTDAEGVEDSVSVPEVAEAVGKLLSGG